MLGMMWRMAKIGKNVGIFQLILGDFMSIIKRAPLWGERASDIEGVRILC